MRPSSESNQRGSYGHSPPKVQSMAFLLHRGNPPAALDLALQFPLTSLPMPRIEPRVPGLSRRPSIDGSVSAGPSKYSYLRGLLFLPLGALFALTALHNWEAGPFAPTWVFIAGVGLTGAACLGITRYYNERYGRLRPSTRQQLRGGLAVLVGVAVTGGGSLLPRSQADWSLDLAVNATAVAFALVMLVSYGLGVGLRPHHVIVWGALLLAGAVPLWTGDDPSNIGVVMAGIALLAR